MLVLGYCQGIRLMGQEVDKDSFTKADRAVFRKRLFEQLITLKHEMSQPNFGKDPLQIGAELEFYLIQDNGMPCLKNSEILTALNDNKYQHELNQYNLELNLDPTPVKGRPFSAIEDQLNSELNKLNTVTNEYHCQALPIGILPTLSIQYLNASCMTNTNRYKQLAEHIYRQRGENFVIDIQGKDQLKVNFSDICAEGANTSFQVHLMVPPDKLTNVFNAAQLTLPLVTAISANSPLLLNKRLWHETRIALFKQSLDMRLRMQHQWAQPARVNFGLGWLRESIWELFAESVALYPTLLPYVNNDENSSPFHELSFHMGTIWPWHRPVFSEQGNKHIRIEFRAIPAGPSNLDMLANAAFAIGLAVGMADKVNDILPSMLFRFAEYNFYRAAQSGIDAKIIWPLEHPLTPTEVDIKQVLHQMLPIAKQGLISLNIHEQEAQYYLSIIEQRLNANITGAIWQLNHFNWLTQRMNVAKASQQLVQDYQKAYLSDLPVSQWERSWT